MNIFEELKQEAIVLGLCKEWTDDWGNPNLDSLCEMYVTGIDFCIKHDYPSTDYIKKNFGKIAEDHGIFVDVNTEFDNPDIAILLGKSKSKINISGYVSRDIYVRHNSEAEITLNDHSIAFVRVFNNAKVKVICKPSSRAFIYIYTDGFTGEIETEGDVRIRVRRFVAMMIIQTIIKTR